MCFVLGWLSAFVCWGWAGYVWLRFGTYHPPEVLDAVTWVGLVPYSTGWVGVDELYAKWLHSDLGINLGLLGFPATWIEIKYWW
jgi:hypothetical protein